MYSSKKGIEKRELNLSIFAGVVIGITLSVMDRLMTLGRTRILILVIIVSLITSFILINDSIKGMLND